MFKVKRFMGLLLTLALGASLLLSACGRVTTSDIRGFLQAVEGKEMIVTLDDGSTIKVTVADNQKAGEASQLVGQQVNVRVQVKNGERQLEDVRRIGEDQKFSGAIESISGDTWVIGGRNFKVTAITRLDGGLAVGVTARVEFITQPDGIMLATEIQTDEEDEKFKGEIQSVSADTWVIGGETFRVNSATRLDQGLAVGVIARVEFIRMTDGTKLALEIETDRPDDQKTTGVIESTSGDTWVIGGRTFKVNNATRFDQGLVVGAMARVKFITLADGTMLATEIETDRGLRFTGTIESVSASTWTIGGKTFTVDQATRLDEGLGVGRKAKVRFIERADGTVLATRIDLDKSGPGGLEQRFEGAIQAIGADAWVVEGKTFKVNQGTRIDGDLKAGQKVRVEFITQLDGTMLATRIRPEGGQPTPASPRSPTPGPTAQSQKFEGVIESMSANAWVIGGRTFRIDSRTTLDSGLAVGVKAKVEFTTQPDGTMLAKEIETAK